MATNTSDELQNLMAGVQGDPNDPNVQKAKLALLFSRWGKPQVQPSSAPDTLDETPGAGSDGGTQGFRQSKPVPGSSEQSSGSPDLAQPKPASQPINLERAGHIPRSQQPSDDEDLKNAARSMVAAGMPVPGASAEPGSTADLGNHVGLPVPPRADAEPGSTEDLENHAESSVPGMFAFAARQNPSRAQRAKNFALNVLGRFGNAGYAISGGDPRAMRLKEQGEQFAEEMEREKSDPEYQRRVAEATTPEDIIVAENPNGGYQYERVNKFTGQASPTGVGAPTPEKSPAQVLNEFVQNHPQALIKGTEDNQHFEELAEGLRAFPSQQAQIRANAEMYVGRLGVQRAIVQADGLLKAMQGRNISEANSQLAQAVNEQIKAAAAGWADFYTQHPYLSALGYGPDAGSQARFMADAIDQLNSIALETNQLTQKIPGTAQVVPPIIHNAANAAARNQKHPQLTPDQIKRGGRLQQNSKTGSYRVVFPDDSSENVR